MNTGATLIIGAGLLGTSIGLALSKKGHPVFIDDNSASAKALAVDYGAGQSFTGQVEPELVVVCVPPDQTAAVVASALSRFQSAVVTDVASVKSKVLAELSQLGVSKARFVGSHPMAGRERGGAISGRSDLFISRPWVLTPTDETDPRAVSKVTWLAQQLGAALVISNPENHDRAVALVSHVPQVVSSLLAARLIESADEDVALAGGGLRDTTRIAASDPELWLQILSQNSREIVPILKEFDRELDSLIMALENLSSPGSLANISNVLRAGNLGVEKIPGKHGTKHTQYDRVVVIIEDKPGELGRLFVEVGSLGVNIEELQLEHSPSAQVGLVELYVMPQSVSTLAEGLLARGWRIAE